MKKSSKIVLLGPESTGKTTLCKQLSSYFKVPFVSEYARTYIANNPTYTFDDVVHIATTQVQEHQQIFENEQSITLFDTDLIITKIWFEEVFHKLPENFDLLLKKTRADLYLLCFPDLRWEADPTRENGSMQKRLYLFDRYKQEIEKLHVSYRIIKGQEDSRFQVAKKAMFDFLKTT